MIARMMRICGLFAICLGAAGAMLLMGNQRFEPRYNRVPVVQDWTHRHMVYSHPKSIIQNLQVQRQSRYTQQFLRRNFSHRPPIGRAPIPRPVRFLPNKPAPNNIHLDWAQVMPGAGYTLGDGVFPAKYTFDVNAAPDCTNDFVVFTTSQAGTGATAIYALNELYTGTCSSVPSTLWAYSVQSHTNGAPVSSPILSLDGTQVAWVEGKGGTATLHILKPYTGGAGTLASPITLTPSASAAAFRACTANSSNQGCLYSIDFANAKDDTGGAGAITPSSPYYDYAYDMIFVGDDAGVLHLFSGIFDGFPAEVSGGSTGWPVTVDTGHALTGPIYDEGSGHVFVGDSAGRLSYVTVAPITFNASGGASWTIAGATSITDPPIVDGTTGKVFVFARTTSGAEVAEADTSLGTQTGPVNVGLSNTVPFHSGVFDNAYYSSDNTAATGNLYVCGNNNFTFPAPIGTVTNVPELYQIPVTNGTIGAATPEFPAATVGGTECSPVSEFYNTTSNADFVFFSVAANGNASGIYGMAAPRVCDGEGCVFGASVTGGTVAIAGEIPASGGASGIVVDNDSNSPGGANIYYSWLGNSSPTYPCDGDTSGTGCTVQVSQLGLGSAGVVVQQDSGDSGGGVTVSTSGLNSNATPGNLILMFSHWDSIGGAMITATASDNGGDTYTALGPAINIGTDIGNDTHWIQAWYAKDISGAPTRFTVTYSATTASISIVDVIEYAGLDQTAPLDTGTYATDTGTGIPDGPNYLMTSAPSGNTTAQYETIIGFFGTQAGSLPYVSGPGFTEELQDATTYVEDMGVSTTGSSYTATATENNPVPYGAIVVGFKNAVQ